MPLPGASTPTSLPLYSCHIRARVKTFCMTSERLPLGGDDLIVEGICCLPLCLSRPGFWPWPQREASSIPESPRFLSCRPAWSHPWGVFPPSALLVHHEPGWSSPENQAYVLQRRSVFCLITQPASGAVSFQFTTGPFPDSPSLPTPFLKGLGVPHASAPQPPVF